MMLDNWLLEFLTPVRRFSSGVLLYFPWLMEHILKQIYWVVLGLSWCTLALVFLLHPLLFSLAPLMSGQAGAKNQERGSACVPMVLEQSGHVGGWQGRRSGLLRCRDGWAAEGHSARD